MRPRASAALVGLLALVAASCADDDPSTVERAEVTTAPSTTSTTEPATSTTAEPCPPVTSPDGDDAGSAAGDVDGDGAPDEVRATTTGSTWHLVAELGRGGGAVLELEVFGGPVGLVGPADVDRDGSDEVWARTGTGAATTIVGLFAAEGCDLTWVTLPDGRRAELPVGGTVGTTSGVECPADGPHLLVHTATYVGDGTEDRYAVTTVAHDLDGAALRERERSTVEVSAQDEGFLRYTSFRCGDLVL